MASEKPPKEAIRIRWMVRRNLDAILAIENESFGFNAWSEDEFIRCLRDRNNIGMVLEVLDRVDGFMIYELGKGFLRVLNFAVHPNARRHGVGKMMIDKLKGKLSASRPKLRCLVREANLPMHLFLKATGFRCKHIVRGGFDDSDELGYEFVWQWKPSAETVTNDDDKPKAK